MSRLRLLLVFIRLFVVTRRFSGLFCMPTTAFGEAKIWPAYPLSDWAATERGTRLTRMRMVMGFGVWLTVERVFVWPRQTARKNIRTYSTSSTPLRPRLPPRFGRQPVLRSASSRSRSSGWCSHHVRSRQAVGSGVTDYAAMSGSTVAIVSPCWIA